MMSICPSFCLQLSHECFIFSFCGKQNRAYLLTSRFSNSSSSSLHATDLLDSSQERDKPKDKEERDKETQQRINRKQNKEEKEPPAAVVVVLDEKVEQPQDEEEREEKEKKRKEEEEEEDEGPRRSSFSLLRRATTGIHSSNERNEKNEDQPKGSGCGVNGLKLRSHSRSRSAVVSSHELSLGFFRSARKQLGEKLHLKSQNNDQDK